MKLGKLGFVNKKGSSLVNVLIAITVMLILSSALLLITAKNSKFSKMVISEFDKYYNLEVQAEKRLKQIDKDIEEVEKESLAYMKDEKYKEDIYFKERYLKSIEGKNLDKFLDEAYGRVYYKKLQQKFTSALPETKTVDKDGIEILDKSVKKRLDKNQIIIQFWTVHTKDYSKINDSNWGDFKAAEGDSVFNIKVKDKNGNTLTVQAKSKVPVYDTTRSVKTTKGLKGNAIWANAITAKGGIKFLNSNTNIYGDLFSSDNKTDINTVITRGKKEGILAEDSTVNIYGNVYSRGDFHVSSETKKSVVDVHKYYDSKNIRCKGFILSNESYYDESILKGVHTSIDFNDTPISTYTEGGEKNKTFPFIFKDNKGGNVYCNDLSVENSAREGSILAINGNVWTNGSVINDSLYGKTQIQLNGAYVGLTSVKMANSENRGSCIVNNIYNTKDTLDNMNKIVLTDRLIVPGVNFIDESGKNKYKTGESITCNFWDKDTILNSYIDKAKKHGGNVSLNFRSVTTENGKNSLVTTAMDKFIANIDKDGEYKRFLKNVYKDGDGDDDDGDGHEDNPGKAENFITNIYMQDKYGERQINGYCEGAAVIIEKKVNRFYLHPCDIDEGYNSIDYRINNNEENKQTYEKLEPILKRIFQSKTMNFGTENKRFDDSVKISELSVGEAETGIKYLNGGGEFNVSGEQKKIIYSEGDLTITGSGTLRGTIICKGNVMIKGNVNFIYDEEVIKKIIKNHEAARKFFEPGETGNYCITEATVDVDQTARKKLAAATYKITQWKKGTEK